MYVKVCFVIVSANPFQLPGFVVAFVCVCVYTTTLLSSGLPQEDTFSTWVVYICLSAGSLGMWDYCFYFLYESINSACRYKYNSKVQIH